jgi:hypothetical protein
MNTSDALMRDALTASAAALPLREVWIAVRIDGLADDKVIGEGTSENPWDGSTALKLDLILRTKIGQNTVIHLGPGIFRTGGARGSLAYEKWRPQSGWKITGSGMYQTTLLLTVYGETGDFDQQGKNVFKGSYSYSMIHSKDSYLDGFEISDVTLDCGLDDQPRPFDALFSWPQTMGGAFLLTGRNILLERVRIINFGTRAPGFINGNSYASHEGYTGIIYPIASLPYHLENEPLSFHQVLENVIFEQPFHSNGREVTPFHTGTGLPIGTADGFEMRRCYFNTDFVNRLPYPPTKIKSLSRTVMGSEAVITINTTGPHNVKANSFPGNVPKPFYVDISGATGNTNYNGRFRVISPETNDGSSTTLQVIMPDPGAAMPTGDITVQDSPAQTLDVTSLAIMSGLTARVTTSAPHRRLVGDWVIISGALNSLGVDDPAYNGSFKVSNVHDVFNFDMTLAQAPAASPAAGMISLDRRPSLHVRMQAAERLWGNAWLIKMHSPHFRKPEEYILPGGLTVAPYTPNAFASYFRVDRVRSPTDLIITIENPDDLADYFDLFEQELVESIYDPVSGANGYISHNFQPYQIGPSPLCVVERNRIIGAEQGGNYHDTWDNVDHIGRKNYHYNVYRGVHENLLAANNTTAGVWPNWGQYSFHRDAFNRGALDVSPPQPIPGGTGWVELRIKCEKQSTAPGKNPEIPPGCLVHLTNMSAYPFPAPQGSLKPMGS